MREYKYFKILDDILTHFNGGNLSITEITIYWVGLNVDFPLDPFLDKLVKDGYISQHDSKKYFITLEGSLLLESGGYVSKEKSKELLATRVENNETRVRRATIWAAIVGGLLLIWEIVSFFLSKPFIEMIQSNIKNFFKL
ncbi:winged helix-turn-helix domain-containing protein [Pedobacter sp. D749]|uniref:winged helix-turn-helix domain-containing protein n=1 Tax=Pedobacter sp. D749 TaxID=2856523 RepID=UPI001C59AFC4|nr:winged helix-turn-helix domain-containing protein [Pedobacter sp. D749]QXU40613.1 winged helix-turn-helix domain-containing protein [Pedobacter sp. D749]